MGYRVIRQHTGNPNDQPVSLHHINDTRVPRIREIDGFWLYRFAEGFDREVGHFAVVNVFDGISAADASIGIAVAWVAEHTANSTRSEPKGISDEVWIRETKKRQEPAIGVMRCLRGKAADACEFDRASLRISYLCREINRGSSPCRGGGW